MAISSDYEVARSRVKKLIAVRDVRRNQLARAEGRLTAAMDVFYAAYSKMVSQPEMVCDHCHNPENECRAALAGNSITLVDPAKPEELDEREWDDTVAELNALFALLSKGY